MVVHINMHNYILIIYFKNYTLLPLHHHSKIVMHCSKVHPQNPGVHNASNSGPTFDIPCVREGVITIGIGYNRYYKIDRSKHYT